MIIPLILFYVVHYKKQRRFYNASIAPTPWKFCNYRQNWRIITAGTLLVAMTTTTFYFITVYTPTYGRTVLNLSARDSLIVTMLVGVSILSGYPLAARFPTGLAVAPY